MENMRAPWAAPGGHAETGPDNLVAWGGPPIFSRLPGHRAGWFGSPGEKAPWKPASAGCADHHLGIDHEFYFQICISALEKWNPFEPPTSIAAGRLAARNKLQMPLSQKRLAPGVPW